MIDFDKDFNDGIEGGFLIDDSVGILFPWYTRSFLKELNSWDIRNWKVFEYGSGNSTLWWRKKSKEVISIDTNKFWSEKVSSEYCSDKNEFINFPKKFTSNGLFDCIIIDGDPVEWRDECIEPSISSLKDGGILIIDNYLQGSIKIDYMPSVEKFLINKEVYIFPQKGHIDWKTAYFIK